MRSFSTFVLVLIINISCKKNDPALSAKESLLTSGSWKIESISFISPSVSFLSPMQSCFADNIYTFSSNHFGNMFEYSMVCPDAYPNNLFKWAFTNNDTLINIGMITLNGLSGPFKVLTLNQTQLTIGKEVTRSSVTGMYVMYFKH
jgi:hypothetical protein